tara:strand:+ start:414 stop:815 length:402 start_codon:yes stop_codon:yes gene_type:complete
MTQNNLSMVFVRKGKIIFESNKNGLAPFIEAINAHSHDIQKAALADKIVGKAAALLAAYAKIQSVYGSILSLEAAKILEYHKIPYKYDKMVDRIINRQGTDLCPYEKAVLITSNPTEALRCIEKKDRILASRQ